MAYVMRLRAINSLEQINIFKELKIHCIKNHLLHIYSQYVTKSNAETQRSLVILKYNAFLISCEWVTKVENKFYNALFQIHTNQ